MNYDEIEVDIDLYKIFYTVYKTGSFSKTAKLLGVTQPSVSYNMIKLENYLNVKLFERGANMILTPEAEELLPYVESALSSFKKAESRMNDLINLKRGTISIGVPSHIGVFLLADMICEFNKKHSNIRVIVISKSTKELIKLLGNNELDIVIDSSPLEGNLADFVIRKLSSEKCAFCCNKKRIDLLQGNKKIDEILKLPLIVPLKTSSSTKELANLCSKSSLQLETQFEMATSGMIAEMVEKDLGIGYLFEKTIDKYKDIEKIKLNVELPVFDIFAIYKESMQSFASKAFIKFICERKKV